MVASELFEVLEALLAFADESGDVYAQSFGLELFEAGDAAAQQARRAAPVAVLLVIEADADLEDALVEVADPTRLFAPGVFEVLVALEELAPIELFYSLEGEVG